MSLLAVLVLSCTPPVPAIGDVLPAAGTTDVPANVAIVFESSIRDGSATAMVVVTSGMGSYSGAAIVDPASGVFVFDPGVSLAPGLWAARITVTAPGGEAGKAVNFTAVASTDAAAPVFSAGDVDFDVGNYFDPGPVEDCPDPPGVYAVHSDWPDATDGTAFFYAEAGQIHLSSQATIGAVAGEVFGLEVFAFDAAGNIGALPIATLDVPGPPGDEGGGCSCAVADRGGRLGGALALVLALVARIASLRRRRIGG